MTSRRGFLAGLLAAGALPVPTWADAGSPDFLTAAKTSAGQYVIVGLAADLSERFRVPLPTRGHAGAAHPTRPEAVAFARRPGTYGLVIDCRSGDLVAELRSPDGRHFYGHGVFSQDGEWLFTPENDYENAAGIIGVWQASRGYRRVGEFASGAIGPHEIAVLPGRPVLVVANGGIETHPDSGRAKLNIPSMRSNLSYLSFDGEMLEQVNLGPAFQRNSIRHLAVRSDGMVGFGMQAQGDGGDRLALAGLHRLGQKAEVLQADHQLWRGMDGYIGSVAFNRDGSQVGFTSPRGGVQVVFNVQTGQLGQLRNQTDICGLARMGSGFLASTGAGEMLTSDGRRVVFSGLAFDNHIVALG